MECVSGQIRKSEDYDMLGTLISIKKGQRLGLVAKQVEGGWMVLWQDGRRQILSWNQRFKKWMVGPWSVKIVSRGEKDGK